mmetsp:Transcript_11834/g.49730  ORF Transcript_11834/g.49730 Transcript_11834/m.49730 type:complete len:222 (+) Transcript_11834:185-850(+)
MGTCLYRLYARPLNAFLASPGSSHSTTAMVFVSGNTIRATPPNRSHSPRSSFTSDSNGRFFKSIATLLRFTPGTPVLFACAPLEAAAASRAPGSTPAAESWSLVSAMTCASPSAIRTATSFSPLSRRSALLTPYLAATAAATVSWRMNREFQAARLVPASLLSRSSRLRLKFSSPAPSRSLKFSPSFAPGGRLAGRRWTSRPWKMLPSSVSIARDAFSGRV